MRWIVPYSILVNSLENAKRLGNLELEAMAMGELGVVYNELSQGEKALHYTRKELDLCLQVSSLHKLPQIYYKIGSAFWSLGQLDSAKVYFQKSLETDNLYTLSEAYEVLYYICVEQKLYKEAIEYNNQYLIYSDSLQVINHAGELAEIQARYDHERLLNINNQLKTRKNESRDNRLVCHCGSVDSYNSLSISCIAEGKIFSAC